MQSVRVWDLPTRCFHWLLAASVTGLLITGSLGGNLMTWHFRLGYLVFTLLLFRMVWGFVGGRWSRFGTFLYSPANVLAYLRQRSPPEHKVGHNPLGGLAVFGFLLALSAQVASGLVSDDEIASTGPLTSLVSNAVVSLATYYHKTIGKPLLIALVVLHLIAILFHLLKKKDNLIRPMIMGDKPVDAVVNAAPSRDDAVSRLAAAAVFVACAGLVAWVVSLGGQ